MINFYIMPLALRTEKKYTYQDYLIWPAEERWEIIAGRAYSMSPAPGIKHQKVAAPIYSRLEKAFEKLPCSVFIAPVDVILSEHDVVQPDVFIVCDEKPLIWKCFFHFLPCHFLTHKTPLLSLEVLYTQRTWLQLFFASSFIIKLSPSSTRTTSQPKAAEFKRLF